MGVMGKSIYEVLKQNDFDIAFAEIDVEKTKQLFERMVRGRWRR